MARIRTIKPEFPQSETIGRLSRDARLLFIQLWTLVDDEGRTRAASRMLASLLYPYDDDARELIDGWLEELELGKCLVRYEVEGTSYLEISNWLKHQKIDRATPSKIPPPREGSMHPRESSRGLVDGSGPGSGSGSGMDHSDISSEISSSSPAVSGSAADGGEEPKTRKKREQSESDLVLLDRISDIWNPWAAKRGLAQIQGLTGTRATACRRRLEYLRQLGHPDPAEAFQFVLAKADQSFFIRGSPSSPLKFDQLLAERFLVQLLEGAYEHRGSRNGQDKKVLNFG